MSEWMPIETARAISPDLDAERFLVWVANGGNDGEGCAAIGYAYKRRDGSIKGYADGYLGFDITPLDAIAGASPIRVR